MYTEKKGFPKKKSIISGNVTALSFNTGLFSTVVIVHYTCLVQSLQLCACSAEVTSCLCVFVTEVLPLCC